MSLLPHINSFEFHFSRCCIFV